MRGNKISVIISAFNGQKYLADQINSILAQVIPVNELTIIDDNSTDNTTAILKDFSIAHPQLIKVHYNKQNQGARRNFEAALSFVSGDIIFFADQDDIWLPEKTSKTLAYLSAHPHLLGVFTNALLIDEENNALPSNLWESHGFYESEWAGMNEKNLFFYLLHYGNVVTGATLAIRKESIALIAPFDLMDRMWHDEWIALKLSATGQLGLIKEPLIRYRIHPKQQVGFGNSLSFRNQRNDRIKSGWMQQNDPTEFFSFKWNVYQTACALNCTTAKTLELLKKEAQVAKMEMLKKTFFPVKKLKLIKWFLQNRYHTTLNEIIHV